MAQLKKSNIFSANNASLKIEGIQNWGDVSSVGAYDIFFVGDKGEASGSGLISTFKSVMTTAANTATELAPIETGLLHSTIRGKYRVKNMDEMEFSILAGGQGAVKDYYNSAFQKTQWNTYVKRSNLIDSRSNRLNIYPNIQENKHHYLEDGLSRNLKQIERAYLQAYEKAIIKAAKNGGLLNKKS